MNNTRCALGVALLTVAALTSVGCATTDNRLEDALDSDTGCRGLKSRTTAGRARSQTGNRARPPGRWDPRQRAARDPAIDPQSPVTHPELGAARPQLRSRGNRPERYPNRGGRGVPLAAGSASSSSSFASKPTVSGCLRTPLSPLPSGPAGVRTA